MQDLNNSALTAFDQWTLRVRESSDRDCRLLLMIHGLTGDENSMWVFGRSMPSKYWIVAPRAPYRLESGGYSWRPPFEAAEFGRPTLEQLKTGAEELVRFVDEYASSAGIDVQTFDVIGFSQGAAMSNVLAFLYPDRVRKTGILAGFVPHGLEELTARRPLEGKPFFVAHGTRDEMVKIDRARESIAILEQAGAKVTYCEDNVGHKVSVTCLRALGAFFAD
ncbi:MAG: alpha/beta hydrolase [Bacteroidota bacterium]